MQNDPPTTWDKLGLARPTDDAPPGSILSPQSGRFLVRSYDGERSNEIGISGDKSGRHYLDATYVPTLETTSVPLVGDTIFYLGEIRGDDAINLWRPTRVVWVGAAVDDYVPVYSITDSHIADRYINEECAPLHLLTEEEREVVNDLGFSLRPASMDQARVLLQIFNCDWLIP